MSDRDRIEAAARQLFGEEWNTKTHLAIVARALAAADRVGDYAKIIAEMKHEQELFDDDLREKQRTLDRIADLIGVPKDEEMDQVDFELWFTKNLAAMASPAAPKEDGWRTMESAPKDGSAIILWLPNSTKMVIGYFENGTSVWWVRHGAMIPEKPLYWQPLPAPPKPKS